MKTAKPVPAAWEISLTYTKKAVPEVHEKMTIKRHKLINVSHNKLYLMKKKLARCKKSTAKWPPMKTYLLVRYFIVKFVRIAPNNPEALRRIFPVLTENGLI